MRLHDHELPAWTREAREDELDEFEAIELALDEVHPPSTEAAALVTSPELLDAALARACMDVRQLECESGFFHDRNPSLWTNEAIWGIVALMLRPPAPLADALASIAMRLHEVGPFLADLRTTITEAVPRPWTARAIVEAQAAQQLCRTDLATWLAEQQADEASATWVLEAAALAATAFAETEAWLRALPDAGDDALRVGEEAYGVLLARGHFVDDSPADLLTQAQDELAEAQQLLEEVAMSLAGGVDALHEMLADEHPAADDYLATFDAGWSACRDFVQEHDLVEWGAMPVRHRPEPQWARALAGALHGLGYRAPSPLEPPAIHEVLVTPVDGVDTKEQTRRLRRHHRSAITVEHVLQTSALGRHVQLWHASRRSTSRVGGLAAVDGASRAGMFLSGTMTDGWAGYAIRLADELGFLSPLDQAVALHFRIRTIVRAIIDLRLHTGSLSFEDAVDFYVTDADLSRASAEQAVTVHSMFPGTAIAGWVGTTRIVALREALMARDGVAFSLRPFHDALLSRGSIPVALAARLLLA